MAAPPINFDSNEAKAYIAIAVGVLGLAYLWLRPMLKKKRNDPLEKAPFASLSQNRAVEREMQNLLVELSQMSRQITAQLDTRAEKLNVLLDEADRRIAELNALRETGIRSQETGIRGQGSEVRDQRSGFGAQELGFRNQGSGVRDQESALSMQATDACLASDSRHLTPDSCSVTPEPEDPRHSDIYALADAGVGAQEISRRLERPRGEIELILALRPKETAHTS